MTAAAAVRPEPDEYAPHYLQYVSAVPDGDIARTLSQQGESFVARLKPLSEAQGAHAYGPGKWTVKEVIGHITDAERIFAYRILRIGRGDATPLASFDENAYAAASAGASRNDHCWCPPGCPMASHIRWFDSG